MQSDTVKADEILQGLNDPQRQAVQATDGPVMVIAGPGSGKTRVLTMRIAYLLAAGKAQSYQVLALTFTNKAAREIKERVAQLVSLPVAANMWLGTFHSVFARLLRRDAEYLGFTRNFSIYDTSDSERVLRDLMKRHRIDTKHFSPNAIRSMISGAKNRMITPEKYSNDVESALQEKVAEIYGPYVDSLQRANALDFDDLLIKPLELFEKEPELLASYQRRWTHLHIDEYQDTNHAQYLLAKKMAAGHKNICVVGDDAQSIYAFRGADITNILSFKRDYSKAAVIRLEQNYRSTQAILRVASSAIYHNKEQLKKNLWTQNQKGDPVTLLKTLSEKDEAQKAEQVIRGLRAEKGYSLRDFAILYRTNGQSRSFEEALRKAGLAYRVIGGMSFYQRKEIKDALAYLRLLVNPNDLASLRRVINYPARGIGMKTEEALSAYARREGIPVWEALQQPGSVGLPPRARNAVAAFRSLIADGMEAMRTESAETVARSLMQQAGIMQDLRKENTPEGLVRWENVQELISAIAEHVAMSDEDASLGGFLQGISLLTDADNEDGETDYVTLMTLHASKGLEFSVVLIVGLEDGLFPLLMNRKLDEMEEERRLFYVGVTRAKERLYLTYARSRFFYGRRESRGISRFVEEVGEDIIESEKGYFRPWKTQKYQEPRKYISESRPRPESGGRRVVYEEGEARIVPGVRVEHTRFGEGKVLKIRGAGRDATAVVFFQGVGEKTLKLRLAKLRRIG